MSYTSDLKQGRPPTRVVPVLSRVERDRLILAHRWLPVRVATDAVRRRPALELEEAIADANVALVEAACRFKPGGTATFGLFAKKWIEGAILDGHFQRNGIRQVLSKGVRSYQHVYETDEDYEWDAVTNEWWREALMDIRHALEGVPPRYQMLLLMAAAGYDPSEIQDGRAAHTALHRARKLMRKACAT